MEGEVIHHEDLIERFNMQDKVWVDKPRVSSGLMTLLLVMLYGMCMGFGIGWATYILMH